jgi:hypothetical protein
MSIQQIQSRGIYHGLPVFPSSINNLTAVVTGANGISGYYMLKVLSQSPQRWSKIYCLSRRPPLIPGGLPDNVTHIALDFLKEPEEIAAVLKEKGVKADYVFFYSYIRKCVFVFQLWCCFLRIGCFHDIQAADSLGMRTVPIRLVSYQHQLHSWKTNPTPQPAQAAEPNYHIFAKKAAH